MTILVRLPAGRADAPDEGPGNERGPEPPRLRAPFRSRRAARWLEMDSRDSIMMLTRRYSRRAVGSLLPVLLVACGNETARAPVPTAYDWPDSMAFRTSVTARAVRDTQTVSSLAGAWTLRFRVRYDGPYAVWRDSVSKTEARSASDTMHYIVQLSRWGELLAVVPDCDPALPPCRDVQPSALQFELREMIPRLPVWWPPRGHAWEDTLRFDDSPRRGGERGSVASVYRAMGDTVAGGSTFWVIVWRSVRRAVDRGPGDSAAPAPVAETGTVYVDKRLLVPAFAEWRATVAPSPAMQLLGATRTEIRGRAVLLGSPFARVPFTQEAR